MFSDLAQRLSSEFRDAFTQSDATSTLDKLIPKRQLELFLQDKLAKLNVVTREEFDAQQAVLARTRARLEALEQQVAALEQQVNNPKAL